MTANRHDTDTLKLFDLIDNRFERIENRLDDRFQNLEAKLDTRLEWEKRIEIRLKELEVKANLAIAVTAVVGTAVISGGLWFFWQLLTNAIDIIPHVIATPHP